MQSSKEIKKFIISFIALIFAVALINKIIKGIKSNYNTDIVSEEGKKILNDPDKRKLLQHAVDHYHETGKWDGLEELKIS